MNEIEVAVVGAGPAGLSASIEVARRGLQVVLFDENSQPGGQLFKQIHKFFGSKDHRAGRRGFEIGYELLEEAQDVGVETRLQSTVFGIFDENIIGVFEDGRTQAINAKAIVLAAGAAENSIAFPGWTLPGVMGAGAAQTMVNLHRVLPGKRVLMIGSGNVGLIVSYQLLQAGADVLAVVENQDKIGGYEVHSAKLKRAGVPILTSHMILQAQGVNQVERAIVVKIDDKGNAVAGSEKVLDVDLICLAVGLSPLAELAWMAECDCIFLPELGGYVPVHDANMETTRKGIYVAGDIAGVEEASTAMEEGKLAGIGIAESLGCMGKAEAVLLKKRINRCLRSLRQGPFGSSRQAAKQRILQFASSTSGERIAKKSLTVTEPLLTMTRVTCEPEDSENLPSPQRLQQGLVAIIECVEEIPCNPCESTCPEKAIQIGRSETNLPRFNQDKCTGCGQCIPSCPGQAIFVVDMTYSKEKSIIQFPYEFLPLPVAGDEVDAVDREGNTIVRATVKGVRNPKNYNQTPVVSLVVPKKVVLKVRSMRRKNGQNAASSREWAKQGKYSIEQSKIPGLSSKSRTTIVCRCEEIDESEVRKAIVQGVTSLKSLKNRTRVGMGLCQGRICAPISEQLIYENMEAPLNKVKPIYVRPPVRPINLGSLAEGWDHD